MSKMNLIIYINKEYEDEGEMALYDKSQDFICVSGDYYHDKIDYQIEGYIKCLTDQETCFNGKETGNPPQEIYIDRTDPMFERLEFVENEELDSKYLN